MGRGGSDSAFHTRHIARPQEIAAFNPLGDEHCCSVHSFRVDMETLQSPWNKSASHVFATNFILHFPQYEDRLDIEKAFFTYLKTVRKQWNSSVIPEEQLAQRQADLSRYQRKVTVRQLIIV